MNELEQRFQMQRMDALFANMVPSAITGLVISSLLCVFFWTPERGGTLLAWTGTAWGMVGVRLSLWLAYRQSRSRHAFPARGWLVAAIGLMALAGVIWGLGLGWMALIGTPLQLVIAISVAVGAISLTIVNLSYWQDHAAFQVPVLLSIACAALWGPHPGFGMLAIASVVLCAGQLVAAYQVSGIYQRAVHVSLENERLAHDLRERGKALEQAVAELRTLSLTDPLTNIANRRAFTERLDMEWRRALRAQTPLSLLAIDVDHFKRYNDQFGHDAGDLCLQSVARALTLNVRDGKDLAARPGGEEFAVLLPETGLEAALLIAERVRVSVRSTTSDPAAALPMCATVSIGVASMVVSQSGSTEILVKEADKALYEAKERGRNGVVGVAV